MKLLPGPPSSVMGLQRWLSAHAETTVVTAIHNFQAAVPCKPPLQKPVPSNNFVCKSREGTEVCSSTQLNSDAKDCQLVCSYITCYRKIKPVYFYSIPNKEGVTGGRKKLIFSPSYNNILKGNKQSRIWIFTEHSVPHHQQWKVKCVQPVPQVSPFPASRDAHDHNHHLGPHKFCSISAHKPVQSLDYCNL